jgi:hypothetical protein
MRVLLFDVGSLESKDSVDIRDGNATWSTSLNTLFDKPFSRRFRRPCHRPCSGKLPLRALGIFVLLIAAASVARAQNRDVVCNRGAGSFDAEFRTGVTIRVDAARSGELATRLCRATFSWEKQTLVIASEVPQVDVDVFGVDLGVGTPAVAFQVKKASAACCVEYEIYSLQKPPKLLHIITGGDFFSAADTDLDGAVEIWTDDAAAIDGFDNLVVGQLDFVPAVVLRFTRGKLFDVSCEFQSFFDDEIAKLRAALDPEDLRNFKASDGRLPAPVPFSVEALHWRDHLQDVKIKVLEIAWAYLYSGREDEAWHVLSDLWPPGDVDRVRTAMLAARARGIRAQVDGVVSTPPANRRGHVQIYDALREKEKGKVEVIPPQPILLWRPRPVGAAEEGLAAAEMLLVLVVDSAGKVRSVESGLDAQVLDAGLKSATANWKFIPAFRGNQAVASRVGLAVSVKR